MAEAIIERTSVSRSDYSPEVQKPQRRNVIRTFDENLPHQNQQPPARATNRSELGAGMTPVELLNYLSTPIPVRQHRGCILREVLERLVSSAIR